MRLTRAQIAEIAEKARKMPPAPAAEVNVTKQEAVRLLAREIEGLQRKGYTMAQIAASFSGDGLELSTATLKSYMSRAQTSKRPRRGLPRPAPPSTKATVASTKPDAPPSTTKDAPAKSGKDAFLVKDKDNY
jgi:hypothetical protein